MPPTAAQKIWQATGLEARQTALMKIGNALIDRADELGELLSREEGKPRAEGRGEVYRAGQFFTYYAAEVLRQIGDNAASVRPGIEIDVRRDPVGVVAVISPWNFPTATAVWKIAPALAFGNAVIWKPANLVPASAVALTEIIADAGLPAGLFNLVMGRVRPSAMRLSRIRRSRPSPLPDRSRPAAASPPPPSATCRACRWKWDRRTPLSSWMTPISTLPSPVPRTAPLAAPARNAPPRRG